METEEDMNNFEKKWVQLTVDIEHDTLNGPIIEYEFDYYEDYKIKCKEFNSMRFSYFKELINAYKKKEFKSFFEHLEATQHMAFLTKELRKFLKKELETKNPQNIIRVLHSIHSLTLNRQAKPNVFASILTSHSIMSYLFDSKFEPYLGSFCFLIKEIAADVLVGLFAKSRKQKWAKSFLSVLNEMFNKDNDTKDSPLAVLSNLCCQCFYDCTKEHFAHFFAISVYLAVGVERIPQKFYPSLKACYDYIFTTVSRNCLSSQCVSKVWDELLVFCEQWIRYSFIKRKDYNGSDSFIIELDYVRNRMRYDCVISGIGYAPCEYPIVPRHPGISPNKPECCSSKSEHYWSFSDVYFKGRRVDDVIIGIGCCENQEQSDNCSAQTSVESSPESFMDVEESHVTEVVQDETPLLEKPCLWFEDLDSMDMDVTCHDIYESLVKHDIAYSFSNSHLKCTKNFKMPNLKYFGARRKRKNRGEWSLI